MTFDELKDLINAQPEILLKLFEPAKQKANGEETFICPSCGNGRGKDGDGVAHVPGKNSWKCFKCGKIDTLLNWYGILTGKAYKEYMHEIAGFYGVDLNGKGQGGQLPGTARKTQQSARQTAKQDTVEQDTLTPEQEVMYRQIIRKAQDRTRTDPDGNIGMSYLSYRGISRDTAEWCGVGIVRKGDWNKATAGDGNGCLAFDSVLFPNANGCFSYRVIDRNADGSAVTLPPGMKKKLKAKYNKRGMAFIQNAMANAKTEANLPCFIVEGEFDALSFYEAGGSAVAICSANNAPYVGSVLYENGYPRGFEFIVALDGDEAGRMHTAEAVKSLADAGYRAVVADVASVFGGCKDANEALLKDRARFARFATGKTVIPLLQDNIEEETKGQKEMTQTQTPAEGQQKPTPEQLKADMIRERLKRSAFTAEDIQALKNPTAEDLEVFPTGFPALDSFLDGGYRQGISIIGGMPSTGKTAFIMQICAEYLKQGRECIVYNLEMPRADLVYRMVSLFTWQIAQRGEAGTDTEADKASRADLYAFSQREVQQWIKDRDSMKRNIFTSARQYTDIIYSEEQWGIRSAVLELAWERFREMSVRLHIAERAETRITASRILEDVQQFKTDTGKKPVVFVDYLQIFPQEADSYRADTRSIVEDAGDKMIQLRNTQKALIFILSSYSRSYYIQPVTQESFKETGGIEFMAEYLGGFAPLHSLMWREKEYTDRFKQQQNFKAKQEPVRHLVFTALKQRGGRPETDFEFTFDGKYSAFECIRELQEPDISGLIAKAEADMPAKQKGKKGKKGKNEDEDPMYYGN